jgi:hypothetical protein
MGVLCTLTVQEGAVPGAAMLYQRKISDLATRAELQTRVLFLQRQEQIQQHQQHPNSDRASMLETRTSS